MTSRAPSSPTPMPCRMLSRLPGDGAFDYIC